MLRGIHPFSLQAADGPRPSPPDSEASALAWLCRVVAQVGDASRAFDMAEAAGCEGRDVGRKDDGRLHVQACSKDTA
jgi:hypothetical protein